MKSMLVNNHIIALQLWDTAGQERFRSIAKSYFRKVDGVVLLYDVTCENSFMNVRDWIESIEESSAKTVPIIICASKTDLRGNCIAQGMPVISRAQGERLAHSFGALFIETSAKEGTNVQEACYELVKRLEEYEDEEHNRVKDEAIKLKEENIKNKKKVCCKL